MIGGTNYKRTLFGFMFIRKTVILHKHFVVVLFLNDEAENTVSVFYKKNSVIHARKPRLPIFIESRPSFSWHSF